MDDDAGRPLYDALAPLYDPWQRADDATPFSQLVLCKLVPALARHGRGRPHSAIASFVDLGCGTGELLIGLRRAHPDWSLTGVDASPGMLAIARGKPGAGGIDWIGGDLGDPGPLPAADAAGCFYDTLNHLPDARALDAAVGRIAAALPDGGLFAFDVTNELGFDRWWRGSNSWRGAGWRIAIQTRYDPALRRGEATVEIERAGQVTAAALVERCFSEPELSAALDAADLETVICQRWSPFDIDAPGKTWWISRKRPKI
jgi:SAM-dependent methyltransferase